VMIRSNPQILPTEHLFKIFKKKIAVSQDDVKLLMSATHCLLCPTQKIIAITRFTGVSTYRYVMFKIHNNNSLKSISLSDPSIKFSDKHCCEGSCQIA